MRILFVSPNLLTGTLGAPKVLLELAEALRRAGCVCDVLSPKDLPTEPPCGAGATRDEFSRRVRRHLAGLCGHYDVVDYDHEHLPFPRTDFCPGTLMVARSVLLVQHLETIGVPAAGGLRAVLGRVLRGQRRLAEQAKRVASASATVAQADLVNVSNPHDKAELVGRGVAAEKIVVLPFGLTRSRRDSLEAVSARVPPSPVVAFVGTFDYRKGAADFPAIVRRVAEAVPEVRFRLLGTAGLFPTAAQVLSFFPRRLRGRIEVRPTFEPDELPALLSDASVGMFPSYFEGFGFGVLEMLAAAVPVVAYDAPGPPVMLPPEWLVPRGNAGAMAEKLVRWLRQPQALEGERTSARERSRRFDWDEIAEATARVYAAHLRNRRALCGTA